MASARRSSSTPSSSPMMVSTCSRAVRVRSRRPPPGIAESRVAARAACRDRAPGEYAEGARDRSHAVPTKGLQMAGTYIVAGARTPSGKMSGALAGFSAAELGGLAIKEALVRAGVAAEEVEHVLMGQVLMAGQGQGASRHGAGEAGIPMSVRSVNINKVCLSGLNTIYLADQMIAAGDADIVVAGGME